jgi:hypothetical protein
MKLTRLVPLMFGALVMTASSLQAATMTVKGTITDAMCGAKHPVADAAGCTKDCVKKGSDYALITSEGKVYTLKADAAAKMQLEKLAGKTADVSGDVNGMTVMVKSAMMAKK